MTCTSDPIPRTMLAFAAVRPPNVAATNGTPRKPMLQWYDWTTATPRLAGSARFQWRPKLSAATARRTAVTPRRSRHESTSESDCLTVEAKTRAGSAT